MPIAMRTLSALCGLFAFSPAQDWIQSPGNGHLYSVTAPMTWDGASNYAQAIGANLVTIESQTEQDWLVQTFASQSAAPLWIGLNDDGHPGLWTWSSGTTSFFTAWAPGEPSHTGGAEHWVEMLPGSGRWNDRMNVAQPALLEMRPRWQWNDDGPAPFTLLGAAGAVDPVRGIGVVGGGPLGMNTAVWNASGWQVFASSPGLSSTSLAFDGSGVIAVSAGSTFRWTGAQWTSVATTGLAPNDGARLAFDAQRGRVVAFGGVEGLAPTAATREWSGIAWSSMSPAHLPAPRAWHALSFHSASRRIVLFGGAADLTGQTLQDDTWVWDGIDWNQVHPAHHPSARTHATLLDMPPAGFAVLLGGRDANGPLSDVWVWDGTDWSPQATDGASHPLASHAAFADPSGSNSEVVVVESALTNPAPRVLRLASASYRTYLNACPGTCGTPELRGLTPPRVGTVFNLRIDHVCPHSFGYLFFTLDDRWLFQNPANPLPLDLGFLGAPGCSINVDTAHRNATVMLLVEQVGNNFIDLPIGLPNVPALLGFEFYNQYAAVDPSANALRIIMTQAARGIVGY